MRDVLTPVSWLDVPPDRSSFVTAAASGRFLSLKGADGLAVMGSITVAAAAVHPFD